MPRSTASVIFQAIELMGSQLAEALLEALLEQVDRLQAPIQKEADDGLATGGNA